jgi:heterodisulfide reductase subunit A
MVLISGCHIGDCHYIDANTYTEKRYQQLRRLMEQGGLDRERLQLVWVSAAEGQIFQDKVNAMRSMLERISKEEIKRGMLFFAEREKLRMEKLAKTRQKLKVAVQT